MCRERYPTTTSKSYHKKFQEILQVLLVPLLQTKMTRVTREEVYTRRGVDNKDCPLDFFINHLAKKKRKNQRRRMGRREQEEDSSGFFSAAIPEMSIIEDNARTHSLREQFLHAVANCTPSSSWHTRSSSSHTSNSSRSGGGGGRWDDRYERSTTLSSYSLSATRLMMNGAPNSPWAAIPSMISSSSPTIPQRKYCHQPAQPGETSSSSSDD